MKRNKAQLGVVLGIALALVISVAAIGISFVAYNQGGQMGPQGPAGEPGALGQNGTDCEPNWPPNITAYTSMDNLSEDDYWNTTLYVEVDDPEDGLIKVEIYWWQPETHPPKWIQLVDETGYDGVYSFQYIPRSLKWVKEPTLMDFMWRVDVTDGFHLVSETYNGTYWHPFVYPDFP